MAGNASEIRRGIYLKVRDEFNHNNVIGLSATPPITQRATHRLEDPFIYIWSESQIETNKTKTDESYQYAVRVEVSTKANSNQGGQQQSDQMAAEIYRIFDVSTDQYPNITNRGYNIYIIEFAETASFVEEVRGGTYFRKVITILATANFVGFDGTDIPAQLTDYTYNNWTYTPTTFDIERYDNGTIIPVTTYPSLPSGWNFVDSVFSIGAGAGGTFANDIYTVGSDDDPVALASTLNYDRTEGGAQFYATSTATTDQHSGSEVLLPPGVSSPFEANKGRIIRIGSNVGFIFNFINDQAQIYGIDPTSGLVSLGSPAVALASNIVLDNAIPSGGSSTMTITGDQTSFINVNDFIGGEDPGALGNFCGFKILTISFNGTNTDLDVMNVSNFQAGFFAGDTVYLSQISTLTPLFLQNYALMATTEWNRIGSLRFGVIESSSQPVFTDDTSASTGIRELSNFQSSDDTIRFGTQNPIGETITFQGIAGQWMYLIIDKSQANLTGLIDSFNEDNLNFFEDPVVVGEYKVYVQKRALSYTNTLTFTIQ